jgi:hypothetical protein
MVTDVNLGFMASPYLGIVFGVALAPVRLYHVRFGEFNRHGRVDPSALWLWPCARASERQNAAE